MIFPLMRAIYFKLQFVILNRIDNGQNFFKTVDFEHETSPLVSFFLFPCKFKTPLIPFEKIYALADTNIYIDAHRPLINRTVLKLIF